MSSTTIVLITLIAYKVVLIAIGFWASRRVETDSDFFIASGGAGNGLGAWTAGLSYAASTSSAWVLLGFTGIVFLKGVVGLWLIPGIFAGYGLTWLIIGPRLNAQTAARGHITIIDFIRDGLSPKWSRAVGIISAAMILFCFVFYISSQFQAAGNALTEVFGISTAKAVILGAAVIVAYCLMGGFWAASITDALQALVMVIACILVPIAVLVAAGGPGEVIAALKDTQPPAYFSAGGGAMGMAAAGAAMGLLGTGLGALGQPQLLNRVMAVRSSRERKKAAAITIIWGVIIYTGLIGLAFSARALNIDTGGESLFFAAAETYLPPVAAGIVIAAVLSAVMSTVDSLLLAAASAVSHDMGLRYRSPQRALFFGRAAMVGVAALAVLLTLYLPKDIFSRVLFSWVALGAAFGPVLLVKCLSPRRRIKGGFVLAAITAGFFCAVIFSGIEGPSADMMEKWGSWLIGLTITLCGRGALRTEESAAGTEESPAR